MADQSKQNQGKPNTQSKSATSTTPGTASSGDAANAPQPKATVDTAIHGSTPEAEGKSVTDGPVDTKVVSEGHTDDFRAGKVTEVTSHIEPTVPQPPAPGGHVDPSHPTIDSYPSEAAAALAPGTHVDLTATTHPVGVVTHNPPPFHRVDGATPGDGKTVTEEVSDNTKSEGL